jgi:hypothetical protein
MSTPPSSETTRLCGCATGRQGGSPRDKTLVTVVGQTAVASQRQWRFRRVLASSIGQAAVPSAPCAVGLPRIAPSEASGGCAVKGQRFPSLDSVAPGRSWSRVFVAGLCARSRPGASLRRCPPEAHLPFARRPGRARRSIRVLRVAVTVRSTCGRLTRRFSGRQVCASRSPAAAELHSR